MTRRGHRRIAHRQRSQRRLFGVVVGVAADVADTVNEGNNATAKAEDAG